MFFYEQVHKKSLKAPALKLNSYELEKYSHILELELYLKFAKFLLQSIYELN